MSMNTRQTRGAENRQQTQKYALFKGRSKKEVEAESLKSLRSENEANDSNKTILKIAKQQSKQKNQDHKTKSKSRSPRKNIQKREASTA